MYKLILIILLIIQFNLINIQFVNCYLWWSLPESIYLTIKSFRFKLLNSSNDESNINLIKELKQINLIDYPNKSIDNRLDNKSIYKSADNLIKSNKLTYNLLANNSTNNISNLIDYLKLTKIKDKQLTKKDIIKLNDNLFKNQIDKIKSDKQLLNKLLCVGNKKNSNCKLNSFDLKYLKNNFYKKSYSDLISKLSNSSSFNTSNYLPYSSLSIKKFNKTKFINQNLNSTNLFFQSSISNSSHDRQLIGYQIKDYKLNSRKKRSKNDNSLLINNSSTNLNSNKSVLNTDLSIDNLIILNNLNNLSIISPNNISNILTNQNVSNNNLLINLNYSLIKSQNSLPLNNLSFNLNNSIQNSTLSSFQQLNNDENSKLNNQLNKYQDDHQNDQSINHLNDQLNSELNDELNIGLNNQFNSHLNSQQNGEQQKNDKKNNSTKNEKSLIDPKHFGLIYPKIPKQQNDKKLLQNQTVQLTTTTPDLNEPYEYDNSTYENEEPVFYPNPEEMLEPWVQNSYFFPIIITYAFSFIVGVTGNMLVIWLMLANKDNRNVTTLFLVSLSVSDLLLLIIYGPLEIINYFVLQWDSDGTICRLSSFAESVSAFGSLLNLLAVTLERFVVIVFPIQSRTLCAMHNCKRVLAGVWILAFFLALPMVFIKTTTKTSFTNHKITVNIYYCKELNDLTTFSVYVYRFLTMFLIPSMIMIACYTWVIKELWISTKNLNNMQTNLTKNTSSFEMNTLPSNQNGQKSDQQSRSRRLARNLNNNVTNLKNKLTSNFVKHCKFNRKTNQETSFIDCDQQEQSNDRKINNWSNYNETSKARNNKINNLNPNNNGIINHENLINKNAKLNEDDLKKLDNNLDDDIQTINCLTLDHNKNYENKINITNFDDNFTDIDLKDSDHNEHTSIEHHNSPTNRNNDKIINEFLQFTNKLTTDEIHSLDNEQIANNSINRKSNNKDNTKDNTKNYYNCSDKVLDAAVLDDSNRNQSMNCILENDENQNHQRKNLNNSNHQPKVVLRRHVRKEAMDVKSARKQVIKMLILIVVLFLICWGPRLMMELIIKCCLHSFNHVTYALRIVFYLLPFIHSCLNPIVYTFMSTKFRNQLINIWHRIRKKGKFSKKTTNNNQGFQRQCSSRQTTIQSDNCTTKIITLGTVETNVN